MTTVRTREEPMAFTRDEFGRGAWWSWFTFMTLLGFGLSAYSISIQASASSDSLVVVLYVMVLFLGYGALIGGVVSLTVMIVLSPVAWMIGRALRRARALALHIAVYTLLGVAIAALAVAALLVYGWDPGATLGNPVILICLVATVASVPTGWWISAHRALREDRGVHRRHLSSRRDVDALFEDGL